MYHRQIEPLEARIAPASLTIADASMSEGNSGIKNMVFTVTLTGTITSAVSVNYATGTDTSATSGSQATSSGLFPDYIATSGALVFKPGGSTIQKISVPIIGDQIQESDEQFKVNLSSPVGVTLTNTSATGKILDDGDTKIGLVLSDTYTTEGDSGTKTVNIVPTLSATSTSDITFTLTTKNGTALAGSDYTATTTLVTIPHGQTTPTTAFAVPIIGDTVFEPTESFFVNLTGAPSNVTVINHHPIDTTSQGTARVYILNDDVNNNLGVHKAQWIDTDGDLVTMAVTKGSLPLSNTTLFTFASSGSVGGKLLQKLDLSDFGTTFAGTSISITASKQAGFPDAADAALAGIPVTPNGRVDVGFIQASTFDASELQVTGIDLGTVTVGGDLAEITAGDQFSTTALGKLNVYSLDSQGFNTLSTGQTSGVVESKILGPIGTIDVQTDVHSLIHVIGGVYGNVGTIKVGGALAGGSDVDSGAIVISGHLGSGTFGSISGGSGVSSGLLLARGTMGNIAIAGSLTGGNGANASTTSNALDSGEITAARIGNITIGGGVIGSGIADKSNSGYIFSSTSIGNVSVAENVQGGASIDSGEIAAQTGLGTVKVGGKLVGGAGQYSGSIRTGGNMASLTVGGSIAGGDGPDSGFIQAVNIGPVSIGKDTAGKSLIGGSGATSGNLTISGSVTSLSIAGDVVGSTTSDTGAVLVTGNAGKIAIGGSVIGSSGANSGFIQALNVGTFSIGADSSARSLIGGSGATSGNLTITGGVTTLTTAGGLVGSTLTNTGAILITGNAGTIAIGGSVAGGAGANSGFIKAANVGTFSIGKDSSGRSLIGAGGAASGNLTISGGVTTLTTAGSVVGGTSGNTGAILITGNAGTLSIGKDSASKSFIGGAGATSGSLTISGGVTTLTTAGDVVGGTVNDTGAILVTGTAGKIAIGGNLTGGNSQSGVFLKQSGFISANWLKAVSIAGNITAGANAGGTNGGLADSGAIRAAEIDSLTVGGNVTGNNTNGNYTPVVIAASGALSTLAIKAVSITGNIKFAEILAGYDDTVLATLFRGVHVSADASIGSVIINGTLQETNIVAGAEVGPDGRFGTTDDTLTTATAGGPTNKPGVLSQIASVVVKGGIVANPAGTASTSAFGIVAQSIGSIQYGNPATIVALKTGPGNDTTPVLIGTASNFFALELPLSTPQGG